MWAAVLTVKNNNDVYDGYEGCKTGILIIKFRRTYI